MARYELIKKIEKENVQSSVNIEFKKGALYVDCVKNKKFIQLLYLKNSRLPIRLFQLQIDGYDENNKLVETINYSYKNIKTNSFGDRQAIYFKEDNVQSVTITIIKENYYGISKTKFKKQIMILIATLLFIGVSGFIYTRVDSRYSNYTEAKSLMKQEKYIDAARMFKENENYLNSEKLSKECFYKGAKKYVQLAKYLDAIRCFGYASGYEDADELRLQAFYKNGEFNLKTGNYAEAMKYFEQSKYDDYEKKILECKYQYVKKYKSTDDYDKRNNVNTYLKELLNANYSNIHTLYEQWKKPNYSVVINDDNSTVKWNAYTSIDIHISSDFPELLIGDKYDVKVTFPNGEVSWFTAFENISENDFYNGVCSNSWYYNGTMTGPFSGNFTAELYDKQYQVVAADSIYVTN